MEFRDGFHSLGLPAEPEQIKAIYEECCGKGYYHYYSYYSYQSSTLHSPP